jgi:tetratricopeptide (TPR) repeat protein
MNRFLLFLVPLILIISCNDGGDASSTPAVLQQPPFVAISDSIKNDAANDELYFRRAILLNKGNFPVEALSDFRTAWSLKKKEAYAHGISSLLIERKPDSAVLFLNTALKELPESVLLQISLGRAFDALNRIDEALETYNAVLKKYPGQLNVLMMKADLFKKKGDSKSLVATLEEAYSIAPFNSEISYNLAYQYAEMKMPRALIIADSLIKSDTLGIEAEPYYIKASYYAAAGDQQKAIHWFDETIRHDHRHLNAILEKGKIYFEQKKIADAMKTFQLANTISPAFADAYYWIGRCQEQQGQKEDAKLSYEKAYSLDKTFTEAKEAAAKLN